MQKQKLFQISMESSRLRTGWKVSYSGGQILGYLLQKGPTNPKHLKDQVALEALEENGFVAKIALPEETEDTLVATEKGRTLYDRILHLKAEDVVVGDVIDSSAIVDSGTTIEPVTDKVVEENPDHPEAIVS